MSSVRVPAHKTPVNAYSTGPHQQKAAFQGMAIIA